MNLSNCLEIITPNGKKLIAEKEIGAGAFGYVLRVRDEDNVVSVVKIVPTWVDNTHKRLHMEKLATREMAFHQFNASTNHPFVVQTFEAWQTSGYKKKEYVSWRKQLMQAFSILDYDDATLKIKRNREEDICVNLYFFHLKYYPKGSLDLWLQWLHSTSNLQKFLNQRAAFSHDILTGVEFLHSKGLIHRDLSPMNILLDDTEDGNLKAIISDFGTIISCGSNAELQLTRTRQEHTRTMGTEVYAAPEVLGSKYDKACDLYSIGVVLLRMHFNLQTVEELQDAILAIENNKDLNVYQCASPSHRKFWLRIIKKQLSRQPNLRVGCTKLLQLLEKENIAHPRSITEAVRDDYVSPIRSRRPNWTQKLLQLLDKASIAQPRPFTNYDRDHPEEAGCEVYDPYDTLKVDSDSVESESDNFSDVGYDSATNILVAMYPYESRADGDLGFRKGDTMLLIDNSNADWWYVEHMQTKQQGYVPCNYVARQHGAESEEWFHGKIQRNVAKRLVLNTSNPQGTFLIREREGDNAELALTIKDIDQEKGESVKHYKIRRMENGGFYITTRCTFDSLVELVQYYTTSSDGLCCKLTNACPKLEPIRQDLSRKLQKEWEIPKTDLQLIRKLGSGNSGEVWYGRYQHNIDIAVKILKPGTMSQEAFLEEAAIMKQCKHPNLMELFAVCSEDEPLMIVTEFMVHGSLLEYLREGNGQYLQLAALVDMSSQIAHGMSYLEDRHIVHRDLAARNILVGDEIGGVPTVKVADFGMARIIEDDVYTARQGAKFPLKWTAPEAAFFGSFTTKSDIWSFGILLYEIFTKGQVPYPGMQNREIIDQVDRGYRLACPRECPEGVYQIMTECWQKEPERRPTFDWLHQYFDDYFAASEPVYGKQN